MQLFFPKKKHSLYLIRIYPVLWGPTCHGLSLLGQLRPLLFPLSYKTNGHKTGPLKIFLSKFSGQFLENKIEIKVKNGAKFDDGRCLDLELGEDPRIIWRFGSPIRSVLGIFAADAEAAWSPGGLGGSAVRSEAGRVPRGRSAVGVGAAAYHRMPPRNRHRDSCRGVQLRGESSSPRNPNYSFNFVS